MAMMGVVLGARPFRDVARVRRRRGDEREQDGET
jgi:hypothetical protein